MQADTRSSHENKASAIKRRLAAPAFFFAGISLLLSLSGCSGYSSSSGNSMAIAKTPAPASIATASSGNVDMLRNQIDNCNSQIAQLQEQSSHLQDIIDDLQGQLAKNQNGNANASLQGRLEALESTTQNITADLRQIKTNANSTSTALSQYKQNIAEIEKTSSLNKDNVRNLEAAVRSLLDFYQQGKGIASSPSRSTSTSEIASADMPAGKKTHKVKSGDTLDKVAKAYGTTTQELKQLNQLKKEDLIFVGQELIVP